MEGLPSDINIKILGYLPPDELVKHYRYTYSGYEFTKVKNFWEIILSQCLDKEALYIQSALRG